MILDVLKDTKEELRGLRVLYKGLVEKFLPVEEASEDEQKAIEEQDGIADEKDW
ncbi:MAG: hypothetical protein ACTSW4_04125 [Candidatus Ranarchaeia archaeon]